MTFEEFKELALNHKFPDEEVIYEINVYEREIYEIQGDLKLGCEVFLKCEYLAPNFEGVEHLIKKQVRCDIPRKRLYAIYVYELPFYKNLKNKMYRRLWVEGAEHSDPVVRTVKGCKTALISENL